MTPFIGLAALGTALALGRKRSTLELGDDITEKDAQVVAEVILNRALASASTANGFLNSAVEFDEGKCDQRWASITAARSHLSLARASISAAKEIVNAAKISAGSLEDKVVKEVRSVKEKYDITADSFDTQCLPSLASQKDFVLSRIQLLDFTLDEFEKAKDCQVKFKRVNFATALLEMMNQFLSAKHLKGLREELDIGGRFDDRVSRAEDFFDQTCLVKKATSAEPPKPSGLVLTPQEKRDVDFLLHFDPSLTPKQIEQSILKARENRKARAEHRSRMDVAKRKEFERRRGLKGFRSRRRRQRFGPATMAP